MIGWWLCRFCVTAQVNVLMRGAKAYAVVCSDSDGYLLFALIKLFRIIEFFSNSSHFWLYGRCIQGTFPYAIEAFLHGDFEHNVCRAHRAETWFFLIRVCDLCRQYFDARKPDFWSHFAKKSTN